MNTKSPLLLLALLAATATVPAQEGSHPGIPDAWAQKLHWRSIGPATMSGRIVDIEVHPRDPSTFWVATASGGLLKTTNNGITFEHQFDRESTVSIGDLAVAASNPDVLYVGTGENHPRNSVSYGDGVYKSTDGGKTWQHIGLRQSFQIGRIAVHPEDENVVYVGALGRLYGPNEERGLYKTVDGGKTWERILYIDENTGVVDLRMHPQDPDTLLVATYQRKRDGFDTNDPEVKIAPGSGLYRTTDGGKTFERLEQGLPTCNLGRIGLDWYQADPNVVFAIVESELIGKPGQKVGWAGFEAEDAEAGARVTEVTKDSPAAKAGIEKGDIVLAVAGNTVLSNMQMLEWLTQFEIGETVTLEVAHAGESRAVELELQARPEPQEQSQDPRERFRRGRRRGLDFRGSLGGQAANMQKLQGKNGHEHGGVYRSDDGGTTWRRINSINPRPMYFSQVRVDPSDDKYLYVLGVSMARSKDGGETFTSDAGRGVHADQHALWIDPRDGRHMIVGTDGGAYVTYDRCENWDHLNHVAIGQFYHVAVGPRRDYWVYGGLQDNGSWGAPMRNKRGSGPLNEDWLRVGGGDGFVCRVDENDPDLIYYESQNGGMGRTHLQTMESGRIRPQAPRGTRYRFNWKTPFILSHFNSRIYYVAGNHVFRSLDRGEGLKRISPEITRTDRGSATALAESPRNADVLYVGTDDGALWGTRDGGQTWTNLWSLEEPAVGESLEEERGGPRATLAEGKPLRELVPGPRWVSSLEASRFEEGRVYLCLDAHRSDDDNPYLLVSEDYGQTWTSITANLPWGSTRVLREDLENENLLYCGTEFAVWASPDRGGKWTRINGNLPTVAVHELAQHKTAGEMVAATHGRSLWILDVTLLRQLTAEAVQADAHLYRPNHAVQWRNLHRTGGTNRRFVGENPSAEAVIFYSLGKEAQEVTLEVREPSGKLVRRLQLGDDAGGKGLHQATWDLRPEPPRRQQQGQGGFRRFGGRFFRGAPQVQPGSYQVVLEVDGQSFSQPLVVEPDPSVQRTDSR